MHFKPEVIPGLEDLSYKPTPHVLFVTNEVSKKPLIDFVLNSKYVNLYQDTFTDFDYLNATSQKLSQNLDIKHSADLLDQGHMPPLEDQSPIVGTMIIKPN